MAIARLKRIIRYESGRHACRAFKQKREMVLAIVERTPPTHSLFIRLSRLRDFACFEAACANLHAHRISARRTRDADGLQIRVKTTPCAVVGV